MIVRLRLFGAEVLALTIGDGEPAADAAADREVDTGVADATLSPDGTIGFGLPRTKHDDEPADRR